MIGAFSTMNARNPPPIATPRPMPLVVLAFGILAACGPSSAALPEPLPPAPISRPAPPSQSAPPPQLALPSQPAPPRAADEQEIAVEMLSGLQGMSLGSGFGALEHDQIIEMVTKHAGTRRCTQPLVDAQLRQNVLQRPNAGAHFDNCAFPESMRFLDDRAKEIDGLVAVGEVKGALFRVGQMLHVIQDFYSHSSYIERLFWVSYGSNRHLAAS
jgi:hypothetical protein